MADTVFEPPAIKGMDKCAIIYRSDPVSFVYVCYHCGSSFSDIQSTLHHIESHFIDENPLKPECKDAEKSTDIDLDMDTVDNFSEMRDPDLDIKMEFTESEEGRGNDSFGNPSTFDCQLCDAVFSSKFSLRTHLLKEHVKESALECGKCGRKFKRDVSFENHLRQHIERGEVDWTCTGDGIREPPPKVERSEKPETSNLPEQLVETQPKKRGPKKKKETTKARSKRKTCRKSSYICHKCSETFSTLSDLNGHFDTHSSEDMLQLYKCKNCISYFGSAFDLRLHVLEIHHLVKKFECSTCSVEFKKNEKSLLEKHLKSHLANNSANWAELWQGICLKVKDVTRHEEISTSSELSCESCGEKFYLKSNLEKHAPCVNPDKEPKLRCPQCKAVFTKTKCYFAHQLEHRRVGATVTETDMNKLSANLTAYIMEQCVYNAKDNATNPYKCLICSVERNTMLDIRTHVRLGHVYRTLPQPLKPGEKKPQEKIACSVCGMSITRASYKNHLKTHAEDKKTYPCSFCGRVFSKNYSKKTHERMHTGEKPFQCDQCGKRFFSNSLLGAHKQSHDSKTFPCKICGRVFSISSGYRRHAAIHRKDQSFECTICFKSFATRVYLTRHMHKHNGRTFQCTICDHKTYTAKGLQKHEESKHNYELSEGILDSQRFLNDYK